jgi:hypothetical protein
MLLYNETHGPSERHVRDRRAVLAYYLRTPQADIWPNDDGFAAIPAHNLVISSSHVPHMIS